MCLSQTTWSAYARVGNDFLTLIAAACIRDDKRRILLLRRSDGLWSAPSGGLEPGERLDQAVVREVREETGLKVEPTALIGVYSDPEYSFTYHNGHQVQSIIVFFKCRVVGGVLRPDLD